MPLPTDKQQRKERPIMRGCLDYFPAAIAEVAHTSYVGNQQHNPGQELHWAREKSADHADCIVRHLMDRGKLDDDGTRHSAKAAWRALALLQLELEAAAESGPKTVQFGVGKPYEKTVQITPARQEEERVGELSAHQILVYRDLCDLGCRPPVAREVAAGVTSPPRCSDVDPSTFYIAGPMRGYEKFNFPTFDRMQASLTRAGLTCISPADIDRAAGVREDDDDREPYASPDQVREFVYRDFFAIYWLHFNNPKENGVVMLPGWESSTGAIAEFFLARWLGLQVRNELLQPLLKFNVSRVSAAVQKFLNGGQDVE